MRQRSQEKNYRTDNPSLTQTQKKPLKNISKSNQT